MPVAMLEWKELELRKTYFLYLGSFSLWWNQPHAYDATMLCAESNDRGS